MARDHGDDRRRPQDIRPDDPPGRGGRLPRAPVIGPIAGADGHLLSLRSHAATPRQFRSAEAAGPAATVVQKLFRVRRLRSLAA